MDYSIENEELKEKFLKFMKGKEIEIDGNFIDFGDKKEANNLLKEFCENNRAKFLIDYWEDDISHIYTNDGHCNIALDGENPDESIYPLVLEKSGSFSKYTNQYIFDNGVTVDMLRNVDYDILIDNINYY